MKKAVKTTKSRAAVKSVKKTAKPTSVKKKKNSVTAEHAAEAIETLLGSGDDFIIQLVEDLAAVAMTVYESRLEDAGVDADDDDGEEEEADDEDTDEEEETDDEEVEEDDSEESDEEEEEDEESDDSDEEESDDEEEETDEEEEEEESDEEETDESDDEEEEEETDEDEAPDYSTFALKDFVKHFGNLGLKPVQLFGGKTTLSDKGKVVRLAKAANMLDEKWDEYSGKSSGVLAKIAKKRGVTVKVDARVKKEESLQGLYATALCRADLLAGFGKPK